MKCSKDGVGTKDAAAGGKEVPDNKLSDNS